MPISTTPTEFRAACRDGSFDGPTSGKCPGFVQANMVIVPADFADEFTEFCNLNPNACPILEILPAGGSEPVCIAAGADIRTDLPRYRVFRDGELVAEPTGVADIWRDDLVTFMLGCSFIAEEALLNAGLILPHIDGTGFVAMYRTTRACVPAGRFQGPMVVSMRPFAPDDADRAAAITARYPMAHGAPVLIGAPEELGIADLANPEYGREVSLAPGQVPVFWACGVTPQAALANARPPLAITHSPGHMFIADITAESTRV
jgi:uncharacterized protein YcsI (UPF0317 family)